MLTRTPLHLFEADAAARQRETRSQASGDPDDLARHAAGQIRRGERPHQVGVDLHRSSPEAHKRLVAGMHPDNPHKAVIAVAPHLHALNHAKHAYDEAVAAAEHNDSGANRTLANRRGAEHGAAVARYKEAAESHGKTPGELFRPHPGEEAVSHLTRMFSSLHNLRRRRSDRRFEFHNDKDAERAEAAARHHYGGGTRSIDRALRHTGFGGGETMPARVWVYPKPKPPKNPNPYSGGL